MILLKNCFYLESPKKGEVQQPAGAEPDRPAGAGSNPNGPAGAGARSSVAGDGAAGRRGWDVLVRSPLIQEIAPKIDADEATRRYPDESLEVIDASRYVVVPGFVNTHHHFFQTLTRALPAAQDAKLFDWLVYHYEVWKHVNAEAVRSSTLLAVGELLKTGCTTTSDHHYLYPKGFEGDLVATQFEAASQLGIRFSPSRGSMSLSKKDGGLPPDSVVQTDEEILKESEHAIQRFHDSSDFSMHRITLAPCSPFSVTPELMKETAALARHHKVRLHTHLAETQDEDAFCMETFGKRPLALMEDCDYLGPDVYYAHGIYFTDEELNLLAKTQTGVSHCPSSNMRLGSGIARIAEMRASGVPVSIGVDGSASNDTSDFLGEMRNALLLQRVKYGSDAIGARDILEMATLGGAGALGFDRVGRIEEGWAADLALFDVHRFEYAGALEDPLAALMFSGYSHQTAYTIVNGTVVVREGKLVGYDEEQLFQEGNAAAKRLVELSRS